jgi:sarcosine oxidase subunit beta
MQPHMFWQMQGTAEADFYGHQTQHGSLRFGGHSGMEAYQEPAYDTQNKPLTASAICRGIMKYFPVLENAKIVRAWAGWIDKCVDAVPVIDMVSECRA